MKSTKTILAVALLIVGFAYVTHAYPPGGNSGNQECCGPQPEDFRYYFVELPPNELEIVVIPEVEGGNGFIITDLDGISTDWFEDAGQGPVLISHEGARHFTTGIPVSSGSSIIAVLPSTATSPRYYSISGYVF